MFLGEVIDYIVLVGKRELRVRAKPEQDFAIGATVALELYADRCVGMRADDSRKL